MKGVNRKYFWIMILILVPIFLLGQEGQKADALITNDAIVLGLLILILGVIFYTDKLPAFKKFYRFVPTLLLCYFIPAICNTTGIISGDSSRLYFVASRYLLPASLVLLCLNIDFPGLINLGYKALVMFFAATIGVMIGGPLALLFVSYIAPGLIDVPAEELWRGLTTIAGSWIGGGANQAAMKEVFEVSDNLFGTMVVVDVLVSNVWLGFLLYGASISDRVDKVLKADNNAITELKNRMQTYQERLTRVASTTDMFLILSVAFGGVALAHLVADVMSPLMSGYKETLNAWGLSTLMSSFFWMITIATTIGLLLSFTKARELEGVGASKWGSVFIYILVATIGMKMDLLAIFNDLGLFAIGAVWMIVHVTILLLTAFVIKAPFFFVAVGSQANIGGAASAPIVASAFHSSLAAVGALMAVLGYALGTYGAYICGLMLEFATHI